MWPRLSRRGWRPAGSVSLWRAVELQCGRGSRAADGSPAPRSWRRGRRASMWPRLSRRGWMRSARSSSSRSRCFNVAAALAPRMGSKGCQHRAASVRFNVAAALAPRMVANAAARELDRVASMWPRLSRRGWSSSSPPRSGRPTRFNVAAALAPRMAEHRRRWKRHGGPASMWPRLSRRGWSSTPWDTRMYAPSFNVAAALAPRMVGIQDDEGAYLDVLQCGRGSRAADGNDRRRGRLDAQTLQCGRGSRAADGRSSS